MRPRVRDSDKTVRRLTNNEGNNDDKDCVHHSPVGSRDNATYSLQSTAPYPPQSVKEDRICGQHNRRRDYEAQQELERRPDGVELRRPGQLTGRGVTRRRRTADSGVGEVRRGDNGACDPDDADGQLTDADRPHGSESMIASQSVAYGTKFVL